MLLVVDSCLSNWWASNPLLVDNWVEYNLALTTFPNITTRSNKLTTSVAKFVSLSLMKAVADCLKFEVLTWIDSITISIGINSLIADSNSQSVRWNGK